MEEQSRSAISWHDMELISRAAWDRPGADDAEKLSMSDSFEDRFRKGVARKMGRWIPSLFSQWPTRPVFIIGCARSGTTLLANLVGQHEDIAHYSEANNIWDPKGYPWRESDLQRPPNWIDPHKFNQMWWDEVSSTGYTKTIKGIFGAYQRLCAKKVFLNKSPMNTFKIPFMLDMFPRARFIHVYRDGRAVVYSYFKKEHKKMSAHPEPYRKGGYLFAREELIEILARSWVEHLAEVERHKKALGLDDAGRLYELSYENLCSAPREKLNDIHDFLELDRQRSGIKELPKIENMNYKYKRDLSEDEVGKVDAIMRSLLLEKGYA